MYLEAVEIYNQKCKTSVITSQNLCFWLISPLLLPLELLNIVGDNR